MSSTEDEASFDPASIGSQYVAYADSLRAFLFGLLRNRELANEALQATFGIAVQKGASVNPGSFRSWLFQVAYNEAMGIRRRQGIESRNLERLSWISRKRSETPEEDLVRRESVRRVREAMQELPAEQLEVVQLRIYEELTFQEIARRLELPLGTVLTRMRLALKKLQAELREPE